MTPEEILIPYKPRALQADLHATLKRWNVLVCHRRFGKTVFGLNEIIRQALECFQPRPRYAYLAPLLKQAKQIAWDYMKFYTACIPGVQYNESELRVDFLDRRIQLLGADNPDALRGLYLDGVVLDEYAQMRRSVFAEIIRPALADRQGWAIFIGTPYGMNHFFDLYTQASNNPQWRTGVYRASDTKVVSQEELDAARQVMSKEQYAQEFECSWESPLAGSFYGDYILQAEVDGRICRVPYNADLPVHTFWDLGISDHTAIWFLQERRMGDGLNLIDYEEHNNVGLDFYISLIKEKPYVYGTHYWPPDGAVREYTTSEPRNRFAQRHGLRVRVVEMKHSERGWIADCVEASRRLLSRCWFDEVKCELGIRSLKAWRKEYDEKLERYKEKPLHDWASHGASAFNLIGMGFRPTAPPPLQAVVHFDPRRDNRQAEIDFNAFGR
ncbi:MAG: terminase family protein [Armatimonadota bacterium]|nr:terminase family protein [Armatimonadota bacterium]